MKVFRVSFPTACMTTGRGVVTLPESVPLLPPKGTRVNDWRPADGHVKLPPIADYMPSSVAAAVCSHELRTLFDSVSPTAEYIQWLPVTISLNSGRTDFFVMHFAGAFDVLDHAKTTFAIHDHPRRPIFKKEFVARYPFFSRDGFTGFEFFVREDLKDDLQKKKFTGLVFESVPQE